MTGQDASGPDGGTHTCARGETIVHEDDDTSRHRDDWPVTAILPLAAFQLQQFKPRGLLEFSWGRAIPRDHVLVQDADSTTRDGAHRQFGVSRRAQLTDDEDVQRSAQRLRHLERHRDAATRQGEHDDIVSTRVGVEGLRKHNSGFAPVCITSGHHSHSPSQMPATACVISHAGCWLNPRNADHPNLEISFHKVLLPGQVAPAPGRREVGHLFESARLLEEMRGPRHDFQLDGGAHARHRRPIEVSTTSSAPPTIRSVGATTRGNASPARSGRPPREITTRTSDGRSAAAIRAAAAPVLAPKQAMGSPRRASLARSQSIASTTRRARRSMSKR